MREQSLFNEEKIYETFEMMSRLQDEEVYEQMSYMRKVMILSVLVLELFTLLMTSQLIPMWWYIQVKREEILKLFCTFSPHSLKGKIEEYEKSANEGVLSSGGREQHKKFQWKMKKRTASNSNSLPRFNWRLFSLTGVIFIIFSVYSLINYLITSSFINEFELYLNQMNDLSALVGATPHLYALNMLRQTATYEKRPDQLLNNLDSKIMSLEKNITISVNNLINFIQSDNKSRFQSAQHTLIVDAMLNDNVCETFQQYQDIYLPGISNYAFSLSDCTNLHKGLWDKGYLQGIRQIVGIFAQVRQLYPQNSPVSTIQTEQFILTLKEYYSAEDGTSLIYLYNYVYNVPKLLTNFLVSSSTSYYELQLAYSFTIFIIAILLAGIAFFKLWNKYYAYLAYSIQSTIKIYGLFSYDLIHDNPFISNYIKKEYSQ